MAEKCMITCVDVGVCVNIEDGGAINNAWIETVETILQHLKI